MNDGVDSVKSTVFPNSLLDFTYLYSFFFLKCIFVGYNKTHVGRKKNGPGIPGRIWDH